MTTTWSYGYRPRPTRVIPFERAQRLEGDPWQGRSGDREGEEIALGPLIKAGKDRRSATLEMLFCHVTVEKLGQAKELGLGCCVARTAAHGPNNGTHGAYGVMLSPQ